MTQMDALADRLDAAAAAMRALGPAVAAGEPWPLTDVYGPGPESTWGPREVLAHVAEMLPYWMGEIELIIDAGVTGSGGSGPASSPVDAGRAEPPAFGRLEDDPARVQIIGRDRRFPGRELLARVDAEAGRVARRFRELSDADAGCIGRHPTRGDLAVGAIAEVLMVRHIEGHVAQLREALAGAR